MRPLLLLPLLCLGLPSGSHAAPPAPAPAASSAVAAPTASASSASAPSVNPPAATPRPGSGEGTRTWLALQSSGTQASATPPTLSGPVLGKVHERYVNSFAIPIPTEIAKTRHP